MTPHLDRMELGDYLEVRGPRGMIIYKEPATFYFPWKSKNFKTRKVKHIGMIAGGTGITPMLQV